MINVVGGVKQRQIVHGRAPRMRVLNLRKCSQSEFFVEHIVPIRSKRMRIAKTVASDFIPFVNVNSAIHR
jgi:hypothetical protein